MIQEDDHPTEPTENLIGVYPRNLRIIDLAHFFREVPSFPWLKSRR
jgi:hypothetical protein